MALLPMRVAQARVQLAKRAKQMPIPSSSRATALYLVQAQNIIRQAMAQKPKAGC